MSVVEDSEFHVGQRVSTIHTEKIAASGTVKYVGPVQGYEGTWVGVEWDSGQGRHDGTVNGVRYFETKEENAGSLVRPKNLSAGISLLEALLLRYKSAGASNSGQDDMYIMSAGQMRVAVQLVGKAQVEERQGHLEILKLATLTHAGVCSAGPPGQLKAACPKLKDLDLTGNLLPDWHEVGRICGELPALQSLNLSCSRLLLDSTDGLPMLRNITTLVLNNGALDWSQVMQCVRNLARGFSLGGIEAMNGGHKAKWLAEFDDVEVLKGSLPNIQELSLCRNNLHRIEVGSACAVSDEAYVQGFESLRLLNLEENHFESWDEILKLSKLKSLEQLYLSENKLRMIFYPSPSGGSDDSGVTMDKKGKPFASLRCLLLGRNQITDWASIDALDLFPALQELRLSENPITDPLNGPAVRYMIVARIGKLTNLNGSQVKQRERRDSEIRYVRHLLTTMQLNSIEDTAKCHPRFEHLRVLHDIPLDLQRGGLIGATQKMSSSLLPVSLVCVAASIGEKAPVIKKLPSATSVGRLKVVCESLFKLKISCQHLFYKEKDSPMPISLDDDMETLADLGFVSGASILVDEVCEDEEKTKLGWKSQLDIYNLFRRISDGEPTKAANDCIC